MKILFIFTGGTIGSSVREGMIATDVRAPFLLLEAYRTAYGVDFDCETVTPYTALSESNTGETLRALCACVATHLREGFDGIVITHGTDTLQYTAAALGYAFADAPCPICIVSAAYPITDPRTNGIVNLRGALRFIKEVSKRGVFVPYRNEGESLRVHNATRLLQGMAYTDSVYSVADSFVGSFVEEKPFSPNPTYAQRADELPAMGTVPLSARTDRILCIQPYVGMCYPEIKEGTRYILHGSFHSGTCNTESEQAKRFFEQACMRGIPVFLTGAMRGTQYESTDAFSALGVQPLHGIAPIAAYMKLWMWDTLHPEQTATSELLQRSLAGDAME